MTRRSRLRLALGAFLVLALVFIVVDPRGIIKPDLQDNLIAETLGAAFTLLVVDLLFEAEQARERKRARQEFRATVLQTLDADLHALWSLLLKETLGRDDPLRDQPREQRIERFLDGLSTPELWAKAPPAHAGAVRGRVRDLGEDAERMLLLAQDVADVETRSRFDALRRACRALDEGWTTTPRGELSSRFATTIAPDVRGVLNALRSPGEA